MALEALTLGWRLLELYRNCFKFQVDIHVHVNVHVDVHVHVHVNVHVDVHVHVDCQMPMQT